MTRKNCLGMIAANTITVVTAIALNVFPRRCFLNRVRTAAVRTRHLISPSMFTEIFRQSSLSGRKTSLTLSLLTILRSVANPVNKKVLIVTDERIRYYLGHRCPNGKCSTPAVTRGAFNHSNLGETIKPVYHGSTATVVPV